MRRVLKATPQSLTGAIFFVENAKYGWQITPMNLVAWMATETQWSWRLTSLNIFTGNITEDSGETATVSSEELSATQENVFSLRFLTARPLQYNHSFVVTYIS